MYATTKDNSDRDPCHYGGDKSDVFLLAVEGAGIPWHHLYSAGDGGEWVPITGMIWEWLEPPEFMEKGVKIFGKWKDNGRGAGVVL